MPVELVQRLLPAGYAKSTKAVSTDDLPFGWRTRNTNLIGEALWTFGRTARRGMRSGWAQRPTKTVPKGILDSTLGARVKEDP